MYPYAANLLFNCLKMIYRITLYEDMDILLSPNQFAVNLFVRRLRETHYHVDEIAVNRAMFGGFFNVIHLGYHIKTDFYVPVEPELKTMISSRIWLPFDEMRRAAYILPTSVIEAKLRAFENSKSTRHLDDIASIVRLQSKKLDRKQIDITAARLGMIDVWREVWEQNQPG